MKSLQQIEDFYINQGYRKNKLREILNRDKGYKKIINERKKKLTNQFNIANKEREKYVLSTDSDFEILAKCKKLEKRRLSKGDKEIVKLIKTQLEYDWRILLINYLNKLAKKYQ